MHGVGAASHHRSQPRLSMDQIAIEDIAQRVGRHTQYVSICLSVTSFSNAMVRQNTRARCCSFPCFERLIACTVVRRVHKDANT